MKRVRCTCGNISCGCFPYQNSGVQTFAVTCDCLACRAGMSISRTILYVLDSTSRSCKFDISRYVSGLSIVIEFMIFLLVSVVQHFSSRVLPFTGIISVPILAPIGSRAANQHPVVTRVSGPIGSIANCWPNTLFSLLLFSLLFLPPSLFFLSTPANPANWPATPSGYAISIGKIAANGLPMLPI